MYSNTCVKQSLPKRQKIGFQDQLLLNAGQKYCRIIQGEHSAILLTFIKLPFVIKIFVLSIFRGHFTQVLLYLYMVIHTSLAQVIIIPTFFLEKKGILISYQSRSVVRLSVCPSVRLSVTFLVNVSRPKPFYIATLNFVYR